jgi:hypothetical protein
MSLRIFRQQTIALGRVFSIAAKFTDPDVYFVGGGVIDTAAHFREWFLATVREATDLMAEQAAVAEVALVPDLDMAGARGSAISAAAVAAGRPLAALGRPRRSAGGPQFIRPSPSRTRTRYREQRYRQRRERVFSIHAPMRVEIENISYREGVILRARLAGTFS